MTEKDTISNIAKGAYHKELVLENVVLGFNTDIESKEYFAFDPNRPELIVEVRDYPGFNVDYNNMIIEHYQDNNIPVVVEGGSREGVLYVKGASKKIDEKEIVLVSSTEKGYLS